MKHCARYSIAIGLIFALLFVFCACSVETHESVNLTLNTDKEFRPESNANRIFSAQIKGGWTPWIYILLYDNARIEVYASNDGAHTLEMCLEKAAQYLIFSELLDGEAYGKAQQYLAELPELREDKHICDAVYVTATYEGTSYEYLLYSEINAEWSELVNYLISVSVKDLEEIEEIVPYPLYEDMG